MILVYLDSGSNGLPIDLAEEDKLKVKNGAGMFINTKAQTTNNLLVNNVIQLSPTSLTVTLLDSVKVNDECSIIIKLTI